MHWIYRFKAIATTTKNSISWFITRCWIWFNFLSITFIYFCSCCYPYFQFKYFQNKIEYFVRKSTSPNVTIILQLMLMNVSPQSIYIYVWNLQFEKWTVYYSEFSIALNQNKTIIDVVASLTSKTKYFPINYVTFNRWTEIY